jgi:signal peptidase II
MRFYFIALFVIALDQASKIGVRMNIEVGDSIVIWEQVLHFTRYENSGIARSMLQGYGRLFVLPAVFVIVMVMYYRKKGHLTGFGKEIGAALLVGGAIGNAIDRVLYNQVTDFIAFQFMDGILNFADHAIMWGGVLLLVSTLIDEIRLYHGARARKT